MPDEYQPDAPDRNTLERTPGLLILDFGTQWCGHCARARPIVDAVLAGHPKITHRRVEDGPGRRLGRSFGVKLWPTLIALRDGQEQARVVRPTAPAQIEALCSALAPRP